MSTTFGIRVKRDDVSFYIDGLEDDSSDDKFAYVKVAKRLNGIRFTNPIAHLLPDDIQVVALDNSQQGIYTIGDIKEAIKNS